MKKLLFKKSSLCRVVSLLASATLLFASVPAGAALAGAAGDEEEKTEAFKQAWQELRVTKTELFAVPNSSSRGLTADCSDLTDDEKTIFGEYYYYNESGTKNFVVPNSKDVAFGFKDYTDKENLRFVFYSKQITGRDGNFELTLGNHNKGYAGTWTYLNNATLKKTTYKPADAFKNVKEVQVKNPNSLKLYMSSIYAVYDAPVSLPEGYESFSAEDWISAAEALDLTDAVSETKEAFISALSGLRSLTAEGRAFNKLMNAWSGLLVQKTEVFAVPNAAASHVTADNAELSDAAKEAFGEYYGYSSGATMIYTYPSGMAGFKDYSGYTNVKFSITQLITNKNTSFGIKFGLSSGNFTSWPYSNKNALKTSEIPISKLNGSKITYIQMENPNKAELYTGCIFVSYEEPADIPEDSGLMSLRELVKAAEKVDLSEFSEEAANSFKGEIAAAKAAIEPIKVDSERMQLLKEGLISAWKQLKYYDEELFAIPEATYLKETTAEAAEAFGFSQEELGKYYCSINLKTDQTVWFKAPDGSTNFDTLEDAVNLKFYYSFLDENGKKIIGVDGGTVHFQLNVTDTFYPNSWVEKTTIAPKEYLSGEKSVTSIKLFYNPRSKYDNFVMGSVYKTVIKTEALPYGYENMELPVLLEYAARLDLTDSKYLEDSVSVFENAVENAAGISDMLVMQRSEALYSAAEAAGIALSDDIAASELIAEAMNADISSCNEKEGFLAALWQMRLCSPDGASVEGLKSVWGNALPENYAQLSVEQWIKEAEAMGNVSDSFGYALRQLKYYFSGIPDVSELKAYTDKALTMKQNNFVSKTYTVFFKQLSLAQDIIASPSGYSQSYVEEVLEALLGAWGGLKYYSRTSYVDFSDYFTGDPDIKLTFKPKDLRNTYAELIKDVKMENGVDRAVRAINVSGSDGVMSFEGKKLMSLNEYSAIEFYIKLDEDFKMPKGYAKFEIQLMNTEGTEWFNYYLVINSSTAKQGWLHYNISLDKFENYANGKRQKDIFINKNGFRVNRVRITLLDGSAGSFTLSNIAALKECNATAGVVPEIGGISIYREPEKVKVIPKNPFTGIDRGDPWGDEYRLTLNRGDTAADEPNTVVKTEINKIVKENKNFPVWLIVIIAAAAVAAAGAGAFVIIKKRGKTE